jgi:hypothetical protein
MRRIVSFAVLALVLSLSSAAHASSGLTRSLWILNQGGVAYLADFFQCVLGGTNWNDLANTYAAGESLVFGGMVQRNDDPCTSSVGSNGFYQCAVDAGKFNVTQYDVVLVVVPESGCGGQNGTATVTNPVSGASVVINVAYVRTGTGGACQTVYAGHEVFEAQTDGVSADCCDGETASGGPFNWCSQCGPYDNGMGPCGQYAPGGVVGNEGWDTIACPNGTYHYQRVSPANHEFDGTCDAVTPKGGPSNPCAGVPPADNGVYCGTSTQNGFAGGSPGVLYDCQNGFVASTQTCPSGCYLAPPGKPDGCNQAASDGGAPDGGAPDASTPPPDASAADAWSPTTDDASPNESPDATSGAASGATDNGDVAGASPGETGGCTLGAGTGPAREALSAWLLASAWLVVRRRRARVHRRWRRRGSST